MCEIAKLRREEIEFWYAIKKWRADEKDRFANYYTKIGYAKTRVNLEILRRFAEAGIALAVPIEAHVQRNGDAERIGPPVERAAAT